MNIRKQAHLYTRAYAHYDFITIWFRWHVVSLHADVAVLQSFRVGPSDIMNHTKPSLSWYHRQTTLLTSNFQHLRAFTS